jgi:fumarate hydratase subunit beta
MIRLHTRDLPSARTELRAGDAVLLSGTVITARDAAHKRIFELLDKNAALPFEISGAVIYYAGPTPARPGMAAGSCGPTTSSRMDIFTPRLLDMGLCAMIGKGDRSPAVIEAMKRNRAVYFCATGGAGALIAKCIKSAGEIAFPELGCESVKELIVSDLPLFTAIDSQGGNLFISGRKRYMIG